MTNQKHNLVDMRNQQI